MPRFLMALGLGAFAALLGGALPVRAADPPAAASAAAPKTEDLILEIRVGKYLAADSFIAQFGDGVTFVPVAQLAGTLEIDAQLHLDRKIVQGEIGAKPAEWAVDAAHGTLRSGGHEEALPAGGYFVGPDDIYLDSRLFEKIWPVAVAARLNLLRLTIESKEPLPIEQRLAREEAHKRLHAAYSYPDFPLQQTPYQLYDVPQADLQFSSQVDRSQPSTAYYSALATGDIADMTGHLFVTGAELSS